VPAFHATDFNNRQKAFKGWDDAKQIQYSKYFTAIAEKQTELAIGRAVETAAYDELVAPLLTEMCWTPNGRFPAVMWCARTCIESLVAKHDRFLRPGDSLEVVFERGGRSGEVVSYLRGLKRRCSDPRGWTQRVTLFDVAPKSVMPLQAADLIVHEGMRSVHEKLEPSGRLIRKSMLRLTHSQRVEVNVFTRQDLIRAIPDITTRIGECEKQSRKN
jgi:hypothetical protein